MELDELISTMSHSVAFGGNFLILNLFLLMHLLDLFLYAGFVILFLCSRTVPLLPGVLLSLGCFQFVWLLST